MLWQKLYIACVLETNPEKLKALIHETENAIISRLHTLETPNDEHQEIARASASLLVLKSERLDRPGHPDSRDPLPDEAGSEHIRELLPANLQSCAEYEQLFDKCLDALTRWTRLRGFEDYPRSIGTLVESEVWRAERNYSAAFSALYQHTRSGSPVCEGGLGVHLNKGLGATIYRRRERALWEHRKSSRDLARRLGVKPLHQNGRHGTNRRHTSASTDVDSHGSEIGERTGVLELLARSLVVPQFPMEAKGLDDPFPKKWDWPELFYSRSRCVLVR